MNAELPILFKNGRVISAGADWPSGWLQAEDGRIQGLGPGEFPELEPGWSGRVIDCAGKTLLPGFIDLHAHGALGHEVMDADPAGLRAMARFYARHGVTAFLATTWTAGRSATLAALQAIGQVQGPVEQGATLLGAHLEGPYLNPSKAGAQEQGHIRRAGREEALEFLQSGLVRLVTLAPEFAENLWLIDECTRQGVTVAAGHTTAGLEEMQRAVEHGLRQVTHTYNAMTGLGHREIGTVGAAMALPEVDCQLIADNIHVHPAAQAILIKVKGPERVILITDALRPTGLPEGEYDLDGRPIKVQAGRVTLPDGTLAGSILTMETALRNAMVNSGLGLWEAYPMSSLNAARSLGLGRRTGSLEVGKDADLALLNPDGSVWMTVARGQVVYAQAS